MKFEKWFESLDLYYDPVYESLFKSAYDAGYNAGANQEEVASELSRLVKFNKELIEALDYHQEQTRPIQNTIDALTKARGIK